MESFQSISLQDHFSFIDEIINNSENNITNVKRTKKCAGRLWRDRRFCLKLFVERKRRQQGLTL
jgi:hypothetical protein